MTPESSTQDTIAQIVTFFGKVGAIAGGAIFIMGMIGAVVGSSEGDAMLAGAGVVLLFGALIVLGIGLMLRPRRGPTPPDKPGG